MSTAPADRRLRRRQETVDEVVDHALAVMAESGAAGLSLGEVARRMQIRTPSLYGYFPSKSALYDEIFARGWRAFTEAIQPYAEPAAGTTLHDHLTGAMSLALEWAAAHPAYAQLMFWRPVPNWEPSAESYAEAEAALRLARRTLASLAQAGRLDPEADLDDAVDVWTVMVSGLISQRLSNEPGIPPAASRTAELVAPLVACFAAHFTRRVR